MRKNWNRRARKHNRRTGKRPRKLEVGYAAAVLPTSVPDPSFPSLSGSLLLANSILPCESNGALVECSFQERVVLPKTKGSQMRCGDPKFSMFWIPRIEIFLPIPLFRFCPLFPRPSFSNRSKMEKEGRLVSIPWRSLGSTNRGSFLFVQWCARFVRGQRERTRSGWRTFLRIPLACSASEGP